MSSSCSFAIGVILFSQTYCSSNLQFFFIFWRVQNANETDFWDAPCIVRWLSRVHKFIFEHFVCRGERWWESVHRKCFGVKRFEYVKPIKLNSDKKIFLRWSVESIFFAPGKFLILWTRRDCRPFSIWIKVILSF